MPPGSAPDLAAFAARVDRVVDDHPGVRANADRRAGAVVEPSAAASTARHAVAR